MASYSVVWRVQRVTVEHAFVSVPVTEDLIVEQPDGTGRIDADRMAERAIEFAQAPEVKWNIEEQEIRLHPIQQPAGPGER